MPDEFDKLPARLPVHFPCRSVIPSAASIDAAQQRARARSLIGLHFRACMTQLGLAVRERHFDRDGARQYLRWAHEHRAIVRLLSDRYLGMF